jgi:hypothetical protein
VRRNVVRPSAGIKDKRKKGITAKKKKQLKANCNYKK